VLEDSEQETKTKILALILERRGGRIGKDNKQ
jgi:hypothetical protein